MVTDPVPRHSKLFQEYERSDLLADLPLPQDDRLVQAAKKIEAALQTENVAEVSRASGEFLKVAAAFYGVSRPRLQVLAARPRLVYETGVAVELFGDYHLQEKRIRLWMRTAVRKRVTSFGTFLATLCHEFCHHLDRELLGFEHTPHTRGFYERVAALYHHCRQTPRKPLYWRELGDGRYAIDWARMRAASSAGPAPPATSPAQ